MTTRLPRWLRLTVATLATLILALVIGVNGQLPKPLPIDPVMRDWTPGCPEWPTHWRGVETETILEAFGPQVSPDSGFDVKWLPGPEELSLWTSTVDISNPIQYIVRHRLVRITDEGPLFLNPDRVGNESLREALPGDEGPLLRLNGSDPKDLTIPHNLDPLAAGTPLDFPCPEAQPDCYWRELAPLPDGTLAVAITVGAGRTQQLVQVTRYDPRTRTFGTPVPCTFYLFDYHGVALDDSRLLICTRDPLTNSSAAAILDLNTGAITPTPVAALDAPLPPSPFTQPHVPLAGNYGLQRLVRIPSVAVAEAWAPSRARPWYALPWKLAYRRDFYLEQWTTHEDYRSAERPRRRETLLGLTAVHGENRQLIFDQFPEETTVALRQTHTWTNEPGLQIFALDGQRVLITQLVYPVPTLDPPLTGILRFGTLGPEDWGTPQWLGYIRLPARIADQRCVPRTQLYAGRDHLLLGLELTERAPLGHWARSSYWWTPIDYPAGWPHGRLKWFDRWPLWIQDETALAAIP